MIPRYLGSRSLNNGSRHYKFKAIAKIMRSREPLGSLVYLLFCMTKKGWGYDGFIHEVNEGEGLRMPDTAMTRTYLTYILPLVVLCVFFGGYLIH